MHHAMLSRGVAALLAATGAWCSLAAWRMGLWMDGAPGAGLLPFVSASLLCVLSVLSVLSVFAEPIPPEEERSTWPRFGIYLLVALMFASLLDLLGSMAVFSLGLLLLLNRAEQVPAGRSAFWAIVLGCGATVFFRLVLDVPLPDPLLDRLQGY